MAGRKVALKAIDWAAFAERVPINQKSLFNALKSRSDAIAAKLASLPETPPAIDWTFYKTTVANPALVDEFEKKFKALQIPMPADTETAKINVQEKESDKTAADFVQASKARIVEYEEELQELRNMIPFENMVYDDLPEKFKDPTFDPIKYPHWPHKLGSDL
ncbi:ATP synthase subunit d, mitochondrial [Pituophis catenifer annectens]|uniref:ATP synthase subunit d, mitochondrial n=1 Tax=Pituophis catenifer annectens TaxID=94852 RepID=UPI003996105E